ncbi:MAG: hypothetical protein DRJ65_11365 [Acidobacteria bacterium]|nr:MAG: hypothetical protein DRJ65_11365 [Acidobacteriota bacterium]
MDLENCLSLPDGPTKTAALVAWVQGLFSDQDEVPVLVGGAAVEILTGGAYTTGDLDFAGSIPASVRKALLKSGFERSGRHWIHQGAQIFLEFPSETLDHREQAIRIEIYGFDVLIVSIEDLLVDRLGGWEYWKSGVDGANAFILFRARRSEVDHKRLARRAREAGFENALEALKEFDQKWSTTDPSPEDLETWANKGPMESN